MSSRIVMILDRCKSLLCHSCTKTCESVSTITCVTPLPIISQTPSLQASALAINADATDGSHLDDAILKLPYSSRTTTPVAPEHSFDAKAASVLIFRRPGGGGDQCTSSWCQFVCIVK
uniref:Uncharacterized protein n=1 Tax=Arundo donax TaxID=35708 RepID=A0A0A8ZR14_ARUDO